MNYSLLLIVILSAIFIPLWLKRRRLVFDVPEGWAGLLYQHGLYIRRNNAGRHIVWGRGWVVKMIDLRKACLEITAQEVLTADHVSLKICLLVAYQVGDPDRAVHETQSWQGELHYAADLALRTVVSGVTLQALLQQRLNIGEQLVGQAELPAGKLGIQLRAMQIKDLVLTGDRSIAITNRLKANPEVQLAFDEAGS